MGRFIFDTLLETLGAQEAYERAKVYFNDPIHLQMAVGVPTSIDQGKILSDSRTEPAAFIKAVDILVDYLNATRTPEHDKILTCLRDAEWMTLDLFVPDVAISPSSEIGQWDLYLNGLGVSFSVVGSKFDDTYAEAVDNATTDLEAMSEEIMNTSYEPLGRFTVYESGTIRFSPYVEAVEPGNGADGSLELGTPDIVPAEDGVKTYGG